MRTPDDHYDPACTGKVGFDLQSHAVLAAKRRSGRSAYRCKACGKWHVGALSYTMKAEHRRRRMRRK